MTSKTKIGQYGEDFAAAFFMQKGYRIVHRNFRVGHLEADLICENETHLLFVEVKSRTDFGAPSKYGRPAAAVDRKKQENLLALVKKYLFLYPTEKKPRIDVAEVYLLRYGGEYTLSAKGIKHIENAIWNPSAS